MVDYRFIYNRKNKLNAHGKALVQVELKTDKGKKYYSAQTYVTPKEWQAQSPELRKRLKRISFQLDSLKTEADFEIYFHKKNPDSFLEFFEEFAQHHQGAYSTYKQYKSTLNHLKRFGGIKMFEDITADNLAKFSDYLKFNGLSTQTVYNAHKRLKTVVRRCLVAEKLYSNPYDRIRIERGRPGDIRYLTPEELEKIQNKDLKIQRLNQVRDIFLLSCYTGLSFSDLYNLEPSDFEEGFIIKKRQKTEERSTIFITDRAKAIFNKYEKLPVLSNQRMNGYLKEIADICGIEKNLTFHMARHTCAVYLLNNGVPMEVVSKILGHASIQTTQVYAKVLKDTVRKYMEGL